jgi:hypothetical protein
MVGTLTLFCPISIAVRTRHSSLSRYRRTFASSFIGTTRRLHGDNTTAENQLTDFESDIMQCLRLQIVTIRAAREDPGTCFEVIMKAAARAVVLSCVGEFKLHMVTGTALLLLCSRCFTNPDHFRALLAPHLQRFLHAMDQSMHRLSILQSSNVRTTIAPTCRVYRASATICRKLLTDSLPDKKDSLVV